MTLTVAGWIECKSGPEAYVDYGEWVPVVNLEPLLHDESEIRRQAPFTGHLVEIGSQGSGQIGRGQGLPDDVSALVARDAARYNLVWDAAFASWTEVRELHGREDLSDDWRLVFKMVEPLADVIGAENVRVVLWGYITDYGVNGT